MLPSPGAKFGARFSAATSNWALELQLSQRPMKGSLPEPKAGELMTVSNATIIHFCIIRITILA